jgi:hypothetical protein
MSGKISRMNPLASRKKLLVAESELNRAQLMRELETMAGEVQSLTKQARTVSSFASAAATLIAGFASLRRKKTAPAAAKASWLQMILRGAGVISDFWQAFRRQGCDQKDK